MSEGQSQAYNPHPNAGSPRHEALAKRRQTIQGVVTVVILALVPAVFAGMLVWAMADPIHRLNDVPAAVVNEDVAVTLTDTSSTDSSSTSSTTVNLGQTIVDNLSDPTSSVNADGENFTWTQTTSDAAAQGLADGRYYVVLTVPKTFSADATSTATATPTNPRQAVLTVTTNDALNYMVGTIADNMATSIANEVTQNVTSQYLQNVYIHFNDLHDNLQQAADNSVKLVDGATAAQDNTGKLVDGLSTLKTKSADLSSGVSKLSAGASTALDGAKKLSTGATSALDGAKKLSTGANNLYGGAIAIQTGMSTASANAAKLDSGAHTMASNLKTLAGGADQLSQALTQLDKGYNTMPGPQRQAMIHQLAAAAQGLDSGAAQASAGAQQLSTGTSNLKAGLATASSNVKKLVSGAKQLKTGATNEVTGLTQLKTGATNEINGLTNLQTGVTTMKSNIPNLVTGATAAYTGATKLADGMDSMKQGAQDMHSGLAEGAANVPTYTQEQINTLPDMASQAATSQSSHLNAIQDFGHALAPFFLSIALWIGCLAFFMIKPVLSKKAIETHRSIPGIFARSVALPAGVAVIQALAAVWTLNQLVGIEPADLPRMTGLAVLVSLTFMMVNQALGALFGAPGRFLAILLLITQVAAAGGIFPILTTPGFIQQAAGILPLGYGVQGFRSTIAGGTLGYSPAVLMLIIWLVCALVATVIGILISRRRKLPQSAQDATVAPEPPLLIP